MSAMDSTSTSSDKLITRYELAHYLQIEQRTIRGWTARGLLPHYRLGKTIRYRVSEVLAALRKTALPGKEDQ